MNERTSRPEIAIVTPVLNDWVSLGRLLQAIDALDDLARYRVRVIAVDDGSTEGPDDISLRASRRRIEELQIIRLACNLGHQRAIAVGLVIASRMPDLAGVAVMDSDGEDRPEDLALLLRHWEGDPHRIVVARRAKRSESLGFRFFYAIYKLLFWILTGKRIGFGNFCLLPANAVRALIYNSAIWNNLAATITRSRLPISDVPTVRGRRYAGTSRLNFVDLAVHGVSAISVYSDVALVRIIVAGIALAGLVTLGLAGVIGIRLTTDLAIPGWASYVGAAMAVLFVQALLLVGLALFQLLSLRSSKTFVPALDAELFVMPAAAPIARRSTAGAPDPAS
jgi:glycosyltransferase involved in cell wall biosynthesis